MFPKVFYWSISNFLVAIMATQSTPTPREWRGTKVKAEKFEEFLDNPSRATFAEGMRETWYYDRAINNLEYYLDNNFLDGQTPEEIAETIEEALRTGNPDPVRKLNGFGWATATETLSALAPSEFALLNTRSAESMQDLGYEDRVPNPRSASLSQYREFSEAVQEAVMRFPLRQQATEIMGEAPPDDTPAYLIADLCFAHHYGKGGFSFDDIDEKPLWQFTQTGVISDGMAERINDEVEESDLYEDIPEFLRAALRNELDRT